MRIIRNEQIVEDHWTLIKAQDDGGYAPLPTGGDIIVPLTLWLRERAALLARPGGLGVWLDSHEEPAAISAELEYFKVIAVNFPKFSDGRGLSIGRLLRERYGYQGELRAIGDVLRDQLFYMKRCGFDSFALRLDRSLEDALHALNDFSDSYQSSVDQPLPLFRRRLA